MPLFDVRALLSSLPVSEMDVASGAGVVPWFRDYALSNQYGPQWEATHVRKDFARVRAPMLLIGEGTADIQRMIIGRRLLEDYKL